MSNCYCLPGKAGGTPIGLDAKGFGDTTMHLLLDAAEKANASVHFIGPAPLPLRAADCAVKPYYDLYRLRWKDPKDPGVCERATMEFVLGRMQVYSRADVAMLERRDFYLGRIESGYTLDARWCGGSSNNMACKLRIALDMVLWQGDYVERITVDGKTLTGLLSQSSKESDAENGLAPRDISNRWLETFGITRGDETGSQGSNQASGSQASISSKLFQIPPYWNCEPGKEGAGDTYCVNGQQIQEDHAYAVATSDHFAQDVSIYKTMAQLPADYAVRSPYFLTEMIAATVVKTPTAPYEDLAPVKPQASLQPKEFEMKQQERGLFQLDFAKLVFGVAVHQPVGGDDAVEQFQGATDSRASSVKTSEVDFESKVRSQWKARWFAVGIQSDDAYDRSVQGNLLGNAVNANYALNSASVGAFLQIRASPYNIEPCSTLNESSHQANDAKPRRWPPSLRYFLEDLICGDSYVVACPYQYQRQIDGTYLFIPYFPSLADSPNELVWQFPAVTGFASKAGYRWEAALRHRFLPDPGTYVEAGAQLVVQNNVLSGVTLTTLGLQAGMPFTFTCPVEGNGTIPMCFKKSGLTINEKTEVTYTTETLHSSGFYWDAHFQKDLLPMKGHGHNLWVSGVVETQGDYFYRRSQGPGLSTQTLYDVPVSAAFAFPVSRNLSFAPTYSTLFYGSQVTEHRLWTNSYTLNLRWYLDRDAAVRGLGQLILFKGPESADQTKNAKMK